MNKERNIQQWSDECIRYLSSIDREILSMIDRLKMDKMTKQLRLRTVNHLETLLRLKDGLIDLRQDKYGVNQDEIL